MLNCRFVRFLKDQRGAGVEGGFATEHPRCSGEAHRSKPRASLGDLEHSSVLPEHRA